MSISSQPGEVEPRPGAGRKSKQACASSVRPSRASRASSSVLQTVQVEHVRGRIVDAAPRSASAAPQSLDCCCLEMSTLEQLAQQVLQPVPVGVGAHQPRGDLGAVDRRGQHAEAVSAAPRCRSGRNERASAPPDRPASPPGSARSSGRGAICTRCASPSPAESCTRHSRSRAGLQAHRLGVDRHHRAEVEPRRQIAVMQMDSHGSSPPDRVNDPRDRAPVGPGRFLGPPSACVNRRAASTGGDARPALRGHPDPRLDEHRRTLDRNLGQVAADAQPDVADPFGTGAGGGIGA